MAFTVNTSAAVLGYGPSDTPVDVALSPIQVTVKNNWPEPDKKSMDAYFGKIELSQGLIPAARWFNHYISRIQLPWKTFASWDDDIRLDLLHVHNSVAPSLQRVCARILREMGPEAIEANGLHLIRECGGYGPDEGRNTLSPHSWGAAIAFDAERNPYKSEKPKTKGYHLDDRIIAAFEDEGWHWRGRDKYHFQPSTFTATSR